MASDLISPCYFAIVPAAGCGKRFNADIPKQYCSLGTKTVLAHSLDVLLTYPKLKQIVVVLAAADPYWATAGYANHPKIKTIVGGAERCHSVLQGLMALRNLAEAQDWVLVHDAARPLLRHQDLDKLIQSVRDHAVGGLLAVPVKDTIKRSIDGLHVQQTLDRNQLWQALTPQLFRYQMLLSALEAAIKENVVVTDEASAIERIGKLPLLVEGCKDNIKITHATDLTLALHFLKQQVEVVK